MIDNLLLLSQVPGLGNSSIKIIIHDNPLFINDREFIKSLISKRFNLKLLPLFERVEAIKDNCCRMGVDIWVNPVRRIPDYPLLLFSKGDKKILDLKRAIAIAGTRSPSSMGIKYSRLFSEYLFKNQGVLISGWAKGCDQVSQKRVLEMGGATVSILPRGIFPEDNRLLDMGNHLLLSEYPPNTPIRKFRCVRRNRIIAGLSKSLYLPEIRDSGGSYHTIDWGRKLNIPIAGTLIPGGRIGYIEIIKTIREFDLYIKKSLK